MSIQAIGWALSQDVAKSTEKFVLVCLANYADSHGFCYPSIERLVRDTSQDRKTVISSIKSLEGMGLLSDTKRRVGRTGSVPIYQIVGLPEPSKNHYIYRVWEEDTGKFYIGKRSCDCTPEADTYRGSGKWTRERIASGIHLMREVLEVFDTAEEAIAAEVRMFRKVEHDPLCMNEGTPLKSKQRNEESSTKNGTTEAVPFLDGSSTVFPTKQYRFSVEAVPKTVHRTIKEPSEEPSKKHTAKFDAKSHLVSLGVDEHVAEDWLALRKSKKATVTKTALDGLQREAFKAKFSMDEAIRECCSRGWQGFKADWVQSTQRKPTWYEENDRVIAELTGRNRKNEPDDGYIDV